MDYNNFYRQLDQLIINSGKLSGHASEMKTHLVSLKQIAFSLYDMNSDGAVCEYDLFSIIKHTDNKMFIQSINQDISDIRVAMDKKISEFYSFDNRMSFDEEQIKIRNLPKWLDEKGVHRDKQGTFY